MKPIIKIATVLSPSAPPTPSTVPPTITTASLPDMIVGTPYSKTLAASGGSPKTWSIAAGALPDGLALVGNQITSTPTTEEAFDVTFQVDNDGGSDTKQFTGWVYAVPNITTTSVTPGTVGGSTAQQIEVSNSAPVTFSVVSGALPPGRSLNTSTGEITGTYTTGGGFNATIRATNPAGTDDQAIEFGVITEAPTLTSPPDMTTIDDTDSPLLQWAAVTGATSYVFEIDNTDNTFASVIDSDEVGTNSAAPTSGLPNDAPYWWHVKTRNAYGDSAWSSARTFTLAILPAQVTITAPTTGSTTSNDTPTITGNTAAFATTYEVQVTTAADTGFASPVETASGLGTPEYTTTLLSQNTAYITRMRGVNSVGNGAWSTTVSFSTPIMSVSDDFNRADGAVGGNWQGATGTIASNALTVTPLTAGAELVSNPSFETGNPPDNWTAVGDPMGRTGTANSGSWAGEVQASDTGENYIYQDVTTTAYRWYVVSAYLTRATAPGAHNLKAESPVGTLRNQSPTNSMTTYNQHRVVALATSTTLRIRANVAAPSVNMRLRIDDASVKEITTLFLWQSLSAGDVHIEAAFTLPNAYNRAAVAHAIDDTHYVAAFIIDKTSVLLLRVNGSSPLEASTTGITYSAGAGLVIERVSGNYLVKYNGSTVIGSTDVSYAGMSAASRVGLFASGTEVTIDNFSASRL